MSSWQTTRTARRIPVRDEAPVMATVVGDNAALFAEAARLYVSVGDVVADVTFGKGTFWRKVDVSKFVLLASDVDPRAPGVETHDLRHLPYEDLSIDVVVLDPPYAHNAGTHLTSAQYNTETVSRLYNADILDLYREGVAEAWRVLNPEGGRLMVKCKDEVEAGVQCWSHVAVYEMALEVGFVARDLFVLVSPRLMPRQAARQLHARKNQSYLWVFQKAHGDYLKRLRRPRPTASRRRLR